MTYLVAKVTSFIKGKSTVSSDPVFTFFFKTTARDRKRAYLKALKKAQADQEHILDTAKEKAHA